MLSKSGFLKYFFNIKLLFTIFIVRAPAESIFDHHLLLHSFGLKQILNPTLWLLQVNRFIIYAYNLSQTLTVRYAELSENTSIAVVVLWERMGGPPLSIACVSF